jgi:phage replication O-like protein O
VPGKTRPEKTDPNASRCRGSILNGNPQPEEGYTPIANELLEAVLRAGFTKQELLVILAVARLTYGWSRKFQAVTSTALSNLTGLDAGHCRKVRTDLIKRGVLIQHGRGGEQLGICKHYGSWKKRAKSARAETARAETARTSVLNQHGGTSKTAISSNAERDPLKQVKQFLTEEGMKKPSSLADFLGEFRTQFTKRHGRPPAGKGMNILGKAAKEWARSWTPEELSQAVAWFFGDAGREDHAPTHFIAAFNNRYSGKLKAARKEASAVQEDQVRFDLRSLQRTREELERGPLPEDPRGFLEALRRQVGPYPDGVPEAVRAGLAAIEERLRLGVAC